MGMQNQMGQINEAMQMVKQLKAMSADPMTALKIAAPSNPQMKMILDLIQASGGNAQAIAQKLLQAKGIDISQLRSVFNA